MNRRDFLLRSGAGAATAPLLASCQDAEITAAGPHPGRQLAGGPVVLWEAEDPLQEVGYCPALALLDNGRILAVMLHYDERPSAEEQWMLHVLTSDDRGQTWTGRTSCPMIDGFPFTAGGSVYVVGGKEPLQILRSDDNGTTWTGPFPITQGSTWYCQPGSAAVAGGRIYFAMEQRHPSTSDHYPVDKLAPVVLGADLNDDLTKPEAWTFSNALYFFEMMEQFGRPHLLGVPFYAEGSYTNPHGDRVMRPIGWSETNLLQIRDPNHIWFDPDQRTFHLFMRARTGRANVACLAKAVVSDDRQRITVGPEYAPSGEPVLYVPLPGGHLTFHFVFDEKTGLFWLLSTQPTDSMRRVDMLEPKRYGMPYNERHRMVLHYSKNAIDWCAAGVVAAVDDVGQCRFAGNMIIDGEELHVLMRYADENAENGHNSNKITFHTVPAFRSLVV